MLHTTNDATAGSLLTDIVLETWREEVLCQAKRNFGQKLNSYVR